MGFILSFLSTKSERIVLNKLLTMKSQLTDTISSYRISIGDGITPSSYRADLLMIL